MSTSPLSRIAGPLAVVTGALVVATRLPTILLILGGGGDLTAYVLGPIHAITSVATIVAFALLVLALVAIYEREASSAGWFGLIGFAAALLGTIFMTGDWWYEAFAVPPDRGRRSRGDSHLRGRSPAHGWPHELRSARYRLGPIRSRQPTSARVSNGHLCRDSGRWPSVWRSHRPCLPEWRSHPGDRHRLARRVVDAGDHRRKWRAGGNRKPNGGLTQWSTSVGLPADGWAVTSIQRTVATRIASAGRTATPFAHTSCGP